MGGHPPFPPEISGLTLPCAEGPTCSATAPTLYSWLTPQAGVHVVSASFGSEARSVLEQRAIQALGAAGTLVVAGSGNSERRCILHLLSRGQGRAPWLAARHTPHCANGAETQPVQAGSADASRMHAVMCWAQPPVVPNICRWAGAGVLPSRLPSAKRSSRQGASQPADAPA